MKEIIKRYHELHTDATPETDEFLREAIRIIKWLNDKQCAMLVKAFWYYMDHQDKTPEECANIIMEADNG